jgi:PAS domain S-box-containing protein
MTREAILKRAQSQALEELPALISLHDRRGNIVWANRAYLEAAGLSLEGIEGKSCYSLWGLEKPCHDCAVVRAIQSGKAEEAELTPRKQIHGTDVKRSLLAKAMPLKDDDGNIIGAIEISIDITEHRRVDEANRQACMHAEPESARLQTLLRSVILQSPVPMVLTLPDGTVELANESCCAVLGVQEEFSLQPDLNLFTMQKTWTDFSAEGIPVPLEELPLALALQGKTTRSRKMRIVRQDGIERWILVDAVPVLDDHGAVMAGFLMFIDITEGKQAEEDLAESLRRLETVVTGAPIVLYSFDRHGVFTLSDGKGLVGMGLKPGEIVGRTIFEIYGDQPLAIAALRRAMAGETFTLELSFPAGGTYEVSHTAMFDDAGDYNGTIGVLVDITERKRAEEQLALERNLYKDLVASQPAGAYRLRVIAQKAWKEEEWIGKVKTNFRFEMVSDQFCRILGVGRAQCETDVSVVVECIHPEDRASFVAQNVVALNPMGPFEWEGRILKSGRVAWVSFASVPRLLENGDVIWTGILLDVTDRKRAEIALRESEERLRLALLAADQGLYDLNVQTGEAVVSAEYARMLGYDPMTFRETNAAWQDRLHPDDREHIGRIFREYVEGQRSEYRIEFRQQTASGEWKWVLSLGKIVEWDNEGKPLRMLGTHTDISERKKAEEEHLDAERNLLHAQKLESLGVLAGGIAHDFNNLLVAVLGHADLALLKISPLSPARQNIREIISASHRAADLCRQMLAYSGKGKFVIEHLQLGDLIYEMTHMLKTCIPKKVLLNFNLEKDLPTIEGDPAQIRQVVMNLVMNASEAVGDRSGIVTISTGAKHCDTEYLRETFTDESLPEGLYVSLEVSDTGCGMDRAIQARIFEPFFTTKFTGRGLGMSAVLGIVRGHKGALKIYSEPGKGTTFRLLFPASLENREVFLEGNVDADVQFHGSGTVLLVDDEETIRGVGQLMLEGLGFSVITAEDGQQAVEIYNSRRSEIAVVLLDLTMPRMNGEEAFRELRRINPGVRVILSSGYSEQEIAGRFAGKGLAGFIQKPFTIKDLAKIVHESLKNDRK